jgi:hypothetical protein
MIVDLPSLGSDVDFGLFRPEIGAVVIVLESLGDVAVQDAPTFAGDSIGQADDDRTVAVGSVGATCVADGGATPGPLTLSLDTDAEIAFGTADFAVHVDSEQIVQLPSLRVDYAPAEFHVYAGTLVAELPSLPVAAAPAPNRLDLNVVLDRWSLPVHVEDAAEVIANEGVVVHRRMRSERAPRRWTLRLGQASGTELDALRSFFGDAAGRIFDWSPPDETEVYQVRTTSESLEQARSTMSIGEVASITIEQV